LVDLFLTNIVELSLKCQEIAMNIIERGCPQNRISYPVVEYGTDYAEACKKSISWYLNLNWLSESVHCTPD
jgi:hypothetical protein